MELELPLVIRLTQQLTVVATEHAAEHPHRQEVIGLRGNPVLAVDRKSAAADHAMQMGMVHQVLTPRMEHGQDADVVGAEVAGVGGHLGDRLAGRLEQHAIEQPLVLQRRMPQLPAAS